MQTHRTASAATYAALSPPPPDSSPRDRRLLELAEEAGNGGHALSLLECIDVSSLCAHDRVTYLRQVTACAGWFEAFQTLATAAVAGPVSGWPEAAVEQEVQADLAEAGADRLPAPDRHALEARARDEAWEVRERALTLEVSLATRVSPRTAGRRIESARLLVEQMPRAVAEAWSGRWGYGHLRVAEKELTDVPSALREQVLDDVMPYAATDHPRRLSERMRKSLAKRDAAGMAERIRERAKERDVSIWNLSDGQARLAITGPYEMVNQAGRQLTELAHARKAVLQAEGTSCAIGALRFDASLASIHALHARLGAHPAGPTVAIHSGDGLHAGDLADTWAIPRAGTPGSRPRQQASVIVDAATALHLADEPGFVPGYGWVPAPIAREILADAQSWRRWLLDDASRRLIDTGGIRYRPSEALRDLVAGRDVTCTADTCTRPASEAQVDHAIDFDGANTTPANVHLVCGPDHLAVTAGHFIIDSGTDDRPLWVSAHSGHAYPSYVDPLHEVPSPDRAVPDA
jgi:hypothetical protein